jgi:hypothetical protein
MFSQFEEAIELVKTVDRNMAAIDLVQTTAGGSLDEPLQTLYTQLHQVRGIVFLGLLHGLRTAVLLMLVNNLYNDSFLFILGWVSSL